MIGITASPRDAYDRRSGQKSPPGSSQVLAPYVQPRHGLQIRVEFCFVENYLTGSMHGAASGGNLRNAVYNGQSEDTGKP